MRWETLFQDLELQMQGLQQQEDTIAVREQIRTQSAQIALIDRLRASVDRPLEITIHTGAQLTGVLKACYLHWLLMQTAAGEAVIPTGAITAVGGLARQQALPATATVSRLTLGHALRGLARDRSVVTAVTVGSEFYGTLGVIGQDWATLHLRRPGELRGSGQQIVIAHGSLCAVLNRN